MNCHSTGRDLDFASEEPHFRMRQKKSLSPVAGVGAALALASFLAVGVFMVAGPSSRCVSLLAHPHVKLEKEVGGGRGGEVGGSVTHSFATAGLPGWDLSLF